MSYKTIAVLQALLVSVALVLAFALSAMWYDIGRESASRELLAACEQRQTVVVNNKKIHCGVIHSAVSIEAARYRSVKNCNRIMRKWQNEKEKREIRNMWRMLVKREALRLP